MRPFVNAQISSDAISGKLIMSKTANPLRIRAAQDVYDVAHAKALPGSRNARQELLRFDGAILHSCRTQAVIAVATVFFLRLLTKVAQERLTTALHTIAISQDLL